MSSHGVLPCRIIDDMKHLTRGKQVHYHRLGMCNMSNIFGVKLGGENYVTDFLNVTMFGVPADSRDPCCWVSGS